MKRIDSHSSPVNNFPRRHHRRGFTLIEVMVAAGVLVTSLLFVFALHTQAVRSNKNAKRMTDCSYLAQTQMERLFMLPWTKSSVPTDLKDSGGADPTSASSPWAYLEHPMSSSQPSAVNASNGPSVTLGPKRYYVTWDVTMMDTAKTWMRIRVRCQYKDSTFATWKGTTISSFRFRDK
ncbi:MAG: prepilin-type N-terminal cleavage/methylation domain-containing protein [Myxococcota bacterium]|nr:prepilin-type N-terminal cleavage/methylation domain-containing protein [Myxococcota bacterium]